MHACIGEGNGSPLQYSCLENPRPSLAGACWAQTEFPSGCGVASPSQVEKCYRLPRINHSRSTGPEQYFSFSSWAWKLLTLWLPWEIPPHCRDFTIPLGLSHWGVDGFYHLNHFRNKELHGRVQPAQPVPWLLGRRMDLARLSSTEQGWAQSPINST